LGLCGERGGPRKEERPTGRGGGSKLCDIGRANDAQWGKRSKEEAWAGGEVGAAKNGLEKRAWDAPLTKKRKGVPRLKSSRQKGILGGKKPGKERSSKRKVGGKI